MSATLMISVSGMRGHVGTDLTPELVARHAAALGAWARSQGQAGGGARARFAHQRADVRARRDGGAHVGRRRRHRRRHRADADGADGGGGSSRRRRADPHREPQSDRVERAQVRRARTASSSTAMPAPRCARWPRRARRGRLGRARRGARRCRGDRSGTSTHILRAPDDRCRDDPRAPVPRGARLRPRRRRRGRCPRCSSNSDARCSGINLETDGRFPRAPEPIPENLGDWASWSGRRSRYRDGGRSRTWTGWRWWMRPGRPIGEDYTLAFAVRAVLDGRVSGRAGWRVPRHGGGATCPPAWWWRTRRGTVGPGSSGPRWERPTSPGPCGTRGR